MKKLRVVCFAMVLALVCVAFGGCAGKPGGDACSIFIYMCGSNLETKQGLAGKNLDELLKADIPADTRVIVQTGGSTTWRSHDIKNDKLQRYEVRDKKLVLLEELDNANMGAKSTFEDFLTWSTGTYGSKRNILVLWDHGGKSADKICFDENFDYDSLDRSELADAFKDAKLPFTFDILVFDACFMSTLENAALASDYARYMVASQEVVPSGGIDYGALAKDFTTHENKDLGVSICDSYLKKCQEKGKADTAELSLLDLSKTKDMTQAVNDLSKQLIATQGGKDSTFKLANATKYSAIYGAKNISNLYDLQGFVDAAALFDDEPDTQRVTEKFGEFVIHKVVGDKTQSAGVSLYYPFNYDRQEFQDYTKTCPMESYAELLKSRYDNLPAQMISFDDKGSITEGGDFKVALSEKSGQYLTSVTYTLAKQSGTDPNSYVLLGSDCDIKQDWDHLTFSSDFRPTWPSLWGQRLLTSVFLMLPHVVAFSSPVRVNNEAWDYFAVYSFGDSYHDGSYVDGALWGGIDANGIPSRNYAELEAGDKIATYAATSMKRDDVALRDEVTIPEGTSDEDANRVEETPLEDGRYRFQFVVSDIAGNNLTSDYGVFEISAGQARLVEVQPQ